MREVESGIVWRDASQLADDIRSRRLSSVEVVQAFMDRIEELDGRYNAFLHVVKSSEALQAAAEADAAVARGDQLGPLHGLPIAVKDLMDVKGQPTTHGTTVHGHIAANDSVLAERLRAAGAIIIGKTNTPEHGLGTLTFNQLGGRTRNPWDRTRHAGGSSGGAAAAVAARMLPLADGSDSGGSIRYPASLCNLVGLRPTPGRVPTGRIGDGWSPHGVLGSIAHNVRDAGLLLQAMSGSDLRAPLSYEVAPDEYVHIAAASLQRLRIGWSANIEDLPIDPEVRRVIAQFRETLSGLGCEIEDVVLDYGEVDRCWEIIEMFNFFASCGDDVERYRAQLRHDLVRNVDQGVATTAGELNWALTERTNIFRKTAHLLKRFDLIATPATPVFAPTIDCDWVPEIDGTVFDRYFYWQRCASRITVTAHPAMSIPAGFSDAGLPIGLQLIGPYRGESTMLSQAAGIEAATGFYRRCPPELVQ